MAKYRPIMIKIWNDSWFLSLTDQEKVFWFFLLTNPYFHISGIYELPKPLTSPFQGGVEMLIKFEQDGKIVYKDGWILIKNYLKNQAEQLKKKDNIYKSICSYLSENPKLTELFNLLNEDPYKTLIRPLGKEERVKKKVIKSKDITPSQQFKNFLIDTKNREEVIGKLIENGWTRERVEEEIEKFIAYWTEPTKNGKKQRWEIQKTFEYKRRLSFWFNNIK